MKLPRRRQFLHLAAGAAALTALSRTASAQAYPTRPVRLIVPFGPAGATDITARLIGHWLSERFGQQFIIENRPGGGGNIGTEAVVRAPPDGYTLLYVTTANASNATAYDKLNFNFIHDVAPVAATIGFPYIMVVSQYAPSQWRAVPGDDGHQYRARSVSQRGGGDDRLAERTSPALLRHHGIVA